MDIFAQVALVLGLAAGFGLIARTLRQPPLIGYVVAGILISGTLGRIEGGVLPEIMELMGKMGVTLLLFLTGLELPISELKKMGKAALVTGLGQIVITSIAGFGLARLLGFETLTAVYIGIGLTFGSTIMVVKLLSEKGDLQSLSGRLATGYLLVQDFVAIGVLVVLSGLSAGNGIRPADLAGVLLKGGLMVAVAVSLSGKVMGKLVDHLARSTELLFITSIGWCLAIAALVASPWVGFSAEIGGLLAGLALANVAEQAQIISRVRPLRDFFLTWFFVYLGSNFQWSGVAGLLVPAGIFSLYVLTVNPLVVMAILGRMGYGRRTYFFTSLAVAQISEFSLIIMASAAALGQIKSPVVSMMTIVALMTMTGSTYLILHARSLYEKFGKRIGWFELPGVHEKRAAGEKKPEGHAVLFGHNRVGSRIRPALEKTFPEVLVVDFNPEVVERLKTEGVNVVYGDMSDRDLYERLGISAAAAVVSTVPDVNDNIHLLKELKQGGGKNGGKKPEQLVVLTANDQVDARRLYELGADYVLVPHSLGGDFLNHVIAQHGVGEDMVEKVRNLGDYLVKKKS
jgi:Kef-type K+ transport system membrane component KefB